MFRGCSGCSEGVQVVQEAVQERFRRGTEPPEPVQPVQTRFSRLEAGSEGVQEVFRKAVQRVFGGVQGRFRRRFRCA